MPNYTAACGGCDRKWNGTVSAHCSVCHRHFSTAANFDLHKPRHRNGRPACGDPALLTRTKTDGTVVRVLKPTESVHGVVWVGWSEYPTAEAEEGQE